MKLLLCVLSVIASIAVVDRRCLAQETDSNVYTVPGRPTSREADSLEAVYRARRAQITEWIARQRAEAVPVDEFASIYAEMGGILRTRTSDISEYFAERAFRSTASDDRDNWRSVDRWLSAGAQFRLSRSWGIFVDYEYSGTYFNTIIDSAAPTVAGLEEELDLNEHSIVTGGMLMLYDGQFYRLRALGGIGAVFAIADELEHASGSSRTSSAVGFQLNFDLVNDFRIAPWGSAFIDLITRSTSTGPLKTSEGSTIDQPFGRGNRTTTIAPRASKTAFGFGIGLLINL